MPIPRKIRSLLHYLLIIISGLLLALVLLTAAVYYIAVSDQERVPEIVAQVCRENFGAEATFSHYSFQYLGHFPFLSLSLEDVALRDPCFDDHGRELLRIGELQAVFRPWKLLRREFELRSIVLENTRLQLYRSADGYFNAAFLGSDSLAFSKDAPDGNTPFSIDKMLVKGLAFDFMDSLRHKHFRLDVQRSALAFIPTDQGYRLQLHGAWFFHGLVFRFENGPYLRGREARMALQFEWSRQEGLRLVPSVAVIGKDTLYLEGALAWQDSVRIRLAISSPGILLDDARPLLADNLQKGLLPYALDRPVAAAVLIDGTVSPGQPQPMTVEFQVNKAMLASGALHFTQASLRGRYINNCNTSGPANPHSDCLDIQLLSARLFDSIAVRANYHARDMKAPAITIEGSMKAPLAGVNRFLPAGRLRFRKGWGEVSFSFAGKPEALTAAGPPPIQLEGGLNIQGGAMDLLPANIQLEDIYASAGFDEQGLRLQSLQFRHQGVPFQISGAFQGIIPAIMGKPAQPFAKLEVYTPQLSLTPFFAAPPPGQSRPASSPDSLGIGTHIGKILDGLADKMEMEIQLKTDELGYRKLRATDVALAGRLLRSCAEAGGARCLLIDSLTAMAFGDIPIRAALRLSRMEDPVVDLSLQLATPLKAFNRMMPPGKLLLKDGEIIMQMNYSGRLNDYSDWNPAALNAALQGQAAIRGAAADHFPRGLEFRNLNGAFHFDAHRLFIDSLECNLNGNEAEVKGIVEGLPALAFHPGQKLRAVLNIQAPELDLNRFPAGKPKRKAEKRPPANPTRITRALESALATIEGSLAVEAGVLRFLNLSLTDVRFRGQLLPACDGQADEKGCILIEKLSARLFGTAPFYSTITVSGMEEPFFTADVQVEMPLQELNRMFAPGQFRFHRGAAVVSFHYEGSPHGHFDVEHALLKAHLKGQGAISGGAFEYRPRGYRFRNVEACFDFDEADLTINDIRLLLNDNALWGKAAFRGFLPFIFLPERELQTTLEVNARQFDFGKFKAPQKFLQPSVGQPQESTIVTHLVNAGLENIRAQLHIAIDSVRYRNFRAGDVKGELTMTPDLLRFENAEMALCDGAFLLNGQVSGLEENRPYIDIQAQFKSADIHQVFRSFDNFGQQSLTSANIRGQLDASILFRARADANYDLLPHSLEGQFGLKVENGALIDLPALDSLQGFLFRKKSLSNIQFATLENSFKLNGQELFIDHFFVASTALSFGVEGRYSLSEAAGTNLLFEVPVRNIFWRGLEVEALEKLNRKRRGLSILLRATDNEAGGLDFRWVLSRGK